MKTCTVCKENKPVNQFELQRCQCLDCRKSYSKVRRAAYYARTRESSILKTKLWREQNPEKKVQFRKAEYLVNAEAAKEAARKYRAQYPAKTNAWSRKHQLSKRMQTPKWLTQDDHWMIEQAYELAALRTKLFGFSWQVDHIVPLQGKLVSGLHTPYNLQVIPAKHNQSKSNQFTVS
jgi:hypothetical protein